MGKVLSKLFPLNRSREATGAPTQVLSKIDMSLVEEAWQFGTLLRRIEDDAATLLSLLQERLPVGQASPIIEQWRRIQNKLQKTVRTVRSLVADGRTKTHDTFVTFSEYLRTSSPDGQNLRLKEIEILINDLRSSSRSTQTTSNIVYTALEQAKTDIDSFRTLCSPCTSEIEVRLKSLEQNIGSVLRGRNVSEPPRNKGQLVSGIVESLALLSVLSSGERHTFSCYMSVGGGGKAEDLARTMGASTLNMFNVLDLLLNTNRMVYVDVLDLQRKYLDYFARNDMASYNMRYTRTRVLYGYFTRAMDELRRSYATAETFGGPCRGQKLEKAHRRLATQAQE